MFGEWKLSYLGTQYAFGPAPHPVQLDSWAQAADQYRVDDVLRPRGDGIWMGEDFIEPGEVTVFATINFAKGDYSDRDRVRLALEARAELGRVWNAKDLRARPNELAELQMGDRCIIEGRPRRPRFDDTRQNVGIIRAELPFVPSMPGSFVVNADGTSWREVEVDIVPPAPRSGWVFPLVFPIENLDPAVKATWFEVGGDEDAACVASIQGPIQAGTELEVPGGFRIVTNRALAYDEIATADARPGRMLLTVNDVPENFLAPSSSLLSGLLLTPGPHQLSFRGNSLPGTARARVRWRDMKAGI